MGKNYATSQSRNRSCALKCDYSYYVNHECLGCKFCYKLLSHNPKPKRRPSSLLNIEKDYNRHLYQVPIVISKYCEPFANDTFKKNSLYAMENILSNGGQVVVRSSQMLPDEAKDLMIKYIWNVQYQPKIFTSDSYLANVMQGSMAPFWIPYGTLMKSSEHFISEGIDTVIYFSPLILGFNDVDLRRVLSLSQRYGIRKIVIRQLFSTPYFKNYLSIIDKNKAALLSEKVSYYSTYDNLNIISHIEDSLSFALRNNIEIAFCCNETLNNLIGQTRNCCHFVNPKKTYKKE